MIKKGRAYQSYITCVLVCCLFLFSTSVKSQCFEIQSILVDACDGNNEGRNEMVIFKVGSAALQASNLHVSWPTTTNNWLGVCQNASTATNVAFINSTITRCGYLKEPVGGILPANSKVLLITSTAFNPSAQSFANLTDTLIVIFQCAGNTQGHFANFGTGIRTLSMNFSPPASCSDAVSYNRALLVDHNLLPGAEDGATVEFSPSGAATYLNNGCQAPFIPLTIDAGPNRISCNTNTQTFSATASSNYNSVQWSLGTNATGIFNSANSLNTTYTPGAGDNGTVKLYCEVMKSCGGTQTITAKDSVTITFSQLPQPVISATTNTLCSGQSVVLSYSLSNATATGTFSAIWLPVNVSSPSISVNSTNTYSVRVTNFCGNNTATYSITAYPTPTVSITANGPTRSCVGNGLILTATSNISDYSWSTGVTTQTISVNSTSTLVVTSINNCGSAQATQTISIALNTFTLGVNTTDITCFGNNNGTATTTITGGLAPFNYTWMPSGGSLPSANNLADGNYTVMVIDFNNCIKNAPFIINEPLPLVASCSNTAATCIGNNGVATVTVSGGIAPYTYTWTPFSSNASTISNISNDSYTITTTDNNGCIASSSTVLSYSNTLLLTINTTDISCFGYSDGKANALVSGGTFPYTYQWSVSGASNTSTLSSLSVGTYSVKIIDTDFCTITNTFSIIQPSILAVTSNSGSACYNQPLSLFAQAVGGTAPYIYSWDNNSFTGQTFLINNTIATKIYSVTAVDKNGCVANDTVSVNILAVPSFSVLSNINKGCPTLCVNFRDSLLTPNTITNWQWNFGDGGSSTINNPTYCFKHSGVYSVSLTLTNNNGCSSKAANSNFITVYPTPISNFDASAFEADVEEANITFTDLSTNAVAWSWNFYDQSNSLSTIQNPSHIFYTEGNYITTLIVKNTQNCIDSISKQILITSRFTFYVPNSFTPNSDDKNDVFMPLGVNWDNTTYSFEIFDRWGASIFKTNDVNAGWDGKLQGQGVKPDVYVWKVQLKDTHKEYHEYVGHVTLVR